MHEHHKLASLALLIALVFAATASSADERNVIVNGEQLGVQQSYQLDRLAGGYFPDGRYWVDYKHGIWGVEGDPNPVGVLGPPTAAGYSPGFGYQAPGSDDFGGVTNNSGVPINPGFGGSYYEDDYESPMGYGDPYGPGYNRRTPGGELLHDGNCGYVVGVPVGGCP